MRLAIGDEQHDQRDQQRAAIASRSIVVPIIAGGPSARAGERCAPVAGRRTGHLLLASSDRATMSRWICWVPS